MLFVSACSVLLFCGEKAFFRLTRRGVPSIVRKVDFLLHHGDFSTRGAGVEQMTGGE